MEITTRIYNDIYHVRLHNLVWEATARASARFFESQGQVYLAVDFVPEKFICIPHLRLAVLPLLLMSNDRNDDVKATGVPR